MAKHNSELLRKILKYDAVVTKKFVTFLLKHESFKTIQRHCKFLEISCNGIVWLALWMAFIWIASSRSMHEMQMNMLLGLLLDIVFVALLKAIVRRQRPTPCTDMMTLGPDKFSFPSGHASRAFFVLLFFTMLSPVTYWLWPPLTAWACSVAVSRIVIQRHYVLDVCAGIVLAFIEACVLSILWLGPHTATFIIEYLSNDYLPGGAE